MKPLINLTFPAQSAENHRKELLILVTLTSRSDSYFESLNSCFYENKLYGVDLNSSCLERQSLKEWRQNSIVFGGQSWKWAIAFKIRTGLISSIFSENCLYFQGKCLYLSVLGYPVQNLNDVWKSSQINKESFGNPRNLLNGSWMSS